jgi:hypothetical protein
MLDHTSSYLATLRERSSQVLPHLFVFVIVRRLECSVGEEEVTFLAERGQRGDEFRVLSS